MLSVNIVAELFLMDGNNNSVICKYFFTRSNEYELIETSPTNAKNIYDKIKCNITYVLIRIRSFMGKMAAAEIFGLQFLNNRSSSQSRDQCPIITQSQRCAISMLGTSSK